MYINVNNPKRKKSKYRALKSNNRELIIICSEEDYEIIKKNYYPHQVYSSSKIKGLNKEVFMMWPNEQIGPVKIKDKKNMMIKCYKCSKDLTSLPRIDINDFKSGCFMCTECFSKLPDICRRVSIVDYKSEYPEALYINGRIITNDA